MHSSISAQLNYHLVGVNLVGGFLFYSACNDRVAHVSSDVFTDPPDPR
jgi:hypothetical protein